MVKRFKQRLNNSLNNSLFGSAELTKNLIQINTNVVATA